MRLLFLMTSFLTSGFSTYLAFASVSREPCAPGCLFQSYPWFSRHCHCIQANIDCKIVIQHHEMDVNAYVQSNFSQALYLSVSECPIPQGLSASTFQAVSSLNKVYFRNTKTTAWNVSSEDLPTHLFYFELAHQAMPHIPLLLQNPSPSLTTIVLDNVTLLDPVLPPWPHVYWLYLSNMNLAFIPPTVLRMPVLEKLVMTNNTLTTLSDALLMIESLKELFVENNAITELSPRWASMSLRQLILDGNPLQSLPEVIPVSWLTSGRIQIRRTPLCQRLQMKNHSQLSAHDEELVAHADAICLG
jgi:hypothetical protein